MGGIKDVSKDFADLRQRAEKHLKEMPESTQFSPEDVQKLLHELHVHQIELEMQNQELRYAETRAAANLRRYTDIYETAPVGYLTLNYEGVIYMANPAAKDMLGYNQSSNIAGQNLKNFISAETYPTLKSFLHESFLIHGSGSQKIGCELAVSEKGGSKRHIRIDGFTAESGGECRVVITDITERKKSEDALKREAQMHKALLHLLRDGVCVFNSDCNVVQVNDALCRMLGYTQEELLSMNIAQWNTQWSLDKLKNRIENLKSSDPKFETRYRRKDGSMIDVEVNESSVVINGQRLILNAVRGIAGRNDQN